MASPASPARDEAGMMGVLRHAAGIHRPHQGSRAGPSSTSMKMLREAMGTAGAHRSPHRTQGGSPERADAAGRERTHAKLVYRDPVPLKDDAERPLKLEGGDKLPYTEEERREFAAEYSQGMHVYTYEGDVKDQDKRDGSGSYTYASGEHYEGPWRMNKRHGPNGILLMTTGHRYEGDWVDDLMHGTGREEFAKGEVYLGDYVKGRMHGRGWLDYGSTGTKYEGEWMDGRKHGAGKMEYANGDVFEGTWVHGRRHGTGVTTYANGRVYESTWVDGRLHGSLRFVRDADGHVATTRPSGRRRHRLNKTTQLPVDLTKWQPKPETKELSTEHFMRIQLAFEKLDTDAGSNLSMSELEKLWPKQDRKWFAQLDRDRNGFVDLFEIYRAWYPSVPKRDVEKYLSTFVTPTELLRHRGALCGLSSGSKGFLQVVAGAEELTRESLKAAKCYIGGEKLSNIQFDKSNARTDKLTMSFVDLLDVWYPNVPSDSIERYELDYLPPEDWDAICDVFEAVATDGVLVIDEFDKAQQRWQHWLADAGSRPPQVPFVELESTPKDELHRIMTEGVFKGEPFWPIGPITVTLKMMKCIDVTQGGWVSLADLLCFNYPNIECLWTQLKWLDRKPLLTDCNCDIHTLTQESTLMHLGL
eukprot:TRINITY_DN14861_c0_g1_i1.p1 TRINITY_DN14861_c0_g1~~TRINITY_DN14861_c0_g1_i1.p1  ORF type:complete len:643 (+),score=194.39 TRINITY_DN14861_c0_g1_i1:53-1981(+)